MGLRCKRCGSEEQVKNGLMRSKQRYLCKACGLNFTDTSARGKPLAMKATAAISQSALPLRARLATAIGTKAELSRLSGPRLPLRA